MVVGVEQKPDPPTWIKMSSLPVEEREGLGVGVYWVGVLKIGMNAGRWRSASGRLRSRSSSTSGAHTSGVGFVLPKSTNNILFWSVVPDTHALHY